MNYCAHLERIENDEPHHSTLHGEVHVLGLNNDFFESDNITIFHFSVPAGERKWI